MTARLLFFLIAAPLLLGAFALPGSSTESSLQADAALIWTSLHKIEERALKDYEFRVASPAVQLRSERLFDMSLSPAIKRFGQNCALAAETLSYMVAGYYQERRRLEVPHSWFHFEKRYLKHRHACLTDLKIEEGKYPLPHWFAR